MNQTEELKSIDQPAHGQRRSGERPGREPQPPRETPPNPCAPEHPAGDGHCRKPPGSRQTPRKPKRLRGRNDACCDQLLRLLSSVPGLDLPKPHKPKQSPARKVRRLCDTLGLSDAILPAVAQMWRRFRGEEDGRNLFEQQVHHIFSTLNPKDSESLDAAFAGYRALRKSGKGDCLFNDCLADAGKVGPIEKTWFTQEILREGQKLAGQVAFKNSGGIMGPGQVGCGTTKYFAARMAAARRSIKARGRG